MNTKTKFVLGLGAALVVMGFVLRPRIVEHYRWTVAREQGGDVESLLDYCDTYGIGRRPEARVMLLERAGSQVGQLDDSMIDRVSRRVDFESMLPDSIWEPWSPEERGRVAGTNLLAFAQAYHTKNGVAVAQSIDVANGVVMEASLRALQKKNAIPPDLLAAASRVMTPAWYYNDMPRFQRRLAADARFEFSADEVLELAKLLSSDEGNRNRHEDIRNAVLHSDPQIRHCAQFSQVWPLLGKPDALGDEQVAFLARFMTPEWFVSEWADVVDEGYRASTDTPSPHTRLELLELAEAMPGVRGSLSLRSDMEQAIVKAAVLQGAKMDSDLWEVMQEFVTPEWFKSYGDGVDGADMLGILVQLREKSKMPSSDDDYDKAFSRYLENSGRASDPTSGRAFYAMLDWLRRNPGEKMPVAFRQTTQKYSPLDKDDLPWLVSSKIEDESRRLIQPDDSVFAPMKSLEREAVMLDHLIDGMRSTFGGDRGIMLGEFSSEDIAKLLAARRGEYIGDIELGGSLADDNLMRLRVGDEDEIQKLGVGILIEYELVSKGFRWGDRLDAELGSLVFIDFEIEWKVSFLAGRGTPERHLRFTSVPPSTVTVDFKALRGEYARTFDFVILEAIKDFQTKFNERMGIRQELNNPDLVRRVFDYLRREVANGNHEAVPGLAQVLYTASDGNHSAHAELVGCRVPDLLSALRLIADRRLPEHEVSRKTGDHVPVMSFERVKIGEAQVHDVDPDGQDWFLLEAEAQPQTITLESVDGKALDAVLYRSLADRSGALSEPVAFKLGAADGAPTRLAADVGPYFICVANANSDSTSYRLSVMPTTNTFSWASWMNVLKPDDAMVVRFSEQKRDPEFEESLAWSLADSLRTKSGGESALYELCAAEKRLDLFFSAFPTNITEEALRALPTLDDILAVASEVPSQASLLADIALNSSTGIVDTIRCIEVFGLNAETTSRWREQVLASGDVEAMIAYLAAIPEHSRDDRALSDAFCAVFSTGVLETNILLHAKALVEYQYLTGEEDMSRFKNVWLDIVSFALNYDVSVWREDYEANLQGVTTQFLPRDRLDAVASYLHAFPDEREALSERVFKFYDVLRLGCPDNSVGVFLELFPPREYEWNQERLAMLLAIASVDDYPDLYRQANREDDKEKIEEVFFDAVVQSPSVTCRVTDETTYTTEVDNQQRVTRIMVDYLELFPEDELRLISALKTSIQKKRDAAIQHRQSMEAIRQQSLMPDMPSLPYNRSLRLP